MARYVDTALSAGEPILYDAKVHWAVFLEPFTKWIGTAVFLAIFWTFYRCAHHRRSERDPCG